MIYEFYNWNFIVSRNGRRNSEKEEDQISAATQLRVETDQLQTELSDLESQIHNVDLTRADLQSSVNALQHSVDDSRVLLGEFSSQEVLFYEQQQHLAVLSSVKKLEPAFPPSAASSHTGGTGEGLDHLRNMEDLYNEAVTNLSAATVHTDQVDDILSARKVRLSALRSQLQEKDLICEEMRQQKNNFQQMAQDVAKSVEFTLRKMAAQVLERVLVGIASYVNHCVSFLGFRRLTTISKSQRWMPKPLRWSENSKNFLQRSSG